MNDLSPIQTNVIAIIDRARTTLAEARSYGEVLEARRYADNAYDVAKKLARQAVREASDELIRRARQVQADALEIESKADIRLADEYDAAQERGEVVGPKDGQHIAVPGENGKATAADLGLTRREIFDARHVRDAEKGDPGIVRRTLDEKLDAGEEPTKAALREAVTAAAIRGLRGAGHSSGNRNPLYEKPSAEWDAMLAVSAGCRSIMDKVRGVDPGTVLAGFIDQGQRERNLAAIRECRDFLSLVLENADAEQA